MDRYAESTKAIIPIIYAPVISPRVAQILKERDIGFVDAAGNCWIRSLENHLLIERTGFRSPRGRTEPSIDPFKPKSSRIVRAMLSQPEKGWQVRELADDANVRVSLGLVVKVKRTLIEEGFAVERDKRVYLRDPGGLLKAWSEKYAGPADEIPLYFRGEAAVAEEAAGRWCKARGLQYALAGFSAAWRLAPEVRYSVGSVYVADAGFDPKLLTELGEKYGGKRVDSGPNLYLWRPFDLSVFADSDGARRAEAPVTSALQSYLDLNRTPGRGEDAANAIFEKHLSRAFQAVEKREQERQRA